MEPARRDHVISEAIRIDRRPCEALEIGDKKNPSLDVLQRLPRALGVPVTELLE